ncbi:MAG TPA: hypothetical protein VJQ47_00385 [Steroidobacteraceae bacterium]|nr:hypothetical protein [Steroidobacteraceae bacterium]
MSKFTWIAWLTVMLALGGCDVQVRDETPAEYPASHDIGMYQIKAHVDRDALVSPGSVFLFAVGNRQRIEMLGDRSGSEWTGLYSVRCQSSFPLQYIAVWKLQGLATKQKRVPSQPRAIRLIEPPLTRDFSADTAVKNPKGWEAAVPYRFVTMPMTQITGAHIEPLSQSAADVTAAKALSVAGDFPIAAPCGEPTPVRVLSKAQHASGNLVIDTDHPAVPHWTTRVEFAPR